MLKKVDGASNFVYGIVTLAANYSCMWFFTVMVSIFKDVLYHFGVFSFMMTVIAAGSTGLLSLYIGKCVGDHYKYSGTRTDWLHSGLIFMIPGEIVRF